MKYVDKNLRVNEHVVAKAKVSWTVMALVIIKALIFLAIGLLIWWDLKDPALVNSTQTISLDLSGVVSSIPGTAQEEAAAEEVGTHLIIHNVGDQLRKPTPVPEITAPIQGLQVPETLNISVRLPDPTLFLICLILVAVIYVVYKALSISAIELVVTEKKLVGKAGIIRSFSVDAYLEKIDYFAIRESFWGRLFNYATIEIGTTASKIRFPYIEYASYFKNTVMDCADRKKLNDMNTLAKMTADRAREKPVAQQ